MSSRALVFDSELLTAVEQEFKSAKASNMAAALVTVPGVVLLLDGMRACLMRKGRGDLLFGVDPATETTDHPVSGSRRQSAAPGSTLPREVNSSCSPSR